MTNKRETMNLSSARPYGGAGYQVPTSHVSSPYRQAGKLDGDSHSGMSGQPGFYGSLRTDAGIPWGQQTSIWTGGSTQGDRNTSTWFP